MSKPLIPPPATASDPGSALATERGRIAKLLHDGLSQTLTGAHFLAEMLARAAARNSSRDAESGIELARTISTAIQDLHSLLKTLRSNAPEDPERSARNSACNGVDLDCALPTEHTSSVSQPPSDAAVPMVSSSPPSSALAAPKRIFLLDDHRLVRQGLVLLLESEPDFVICGQAEDAASALSQIMSLKPDVLVSDISLPGMNGIEFLKHVKAQLPRIAVVVLSMHDESVYAERSLRAGAFAYIMKKDGVEEIVSAIHKALNGEYYVSSRVTGAIFNKVLGGSGSGKNAAASPLSLLTDRELEVFELLGHGKSTREVANSLRLSPKTIESHRAHIKNKLQLKSNAEMIRHATLWVEHESASAQG